MGISIKDFISYTSKNVAGNYYAYGFPAEAKSPGVAVSFFTTQPRRLGTGIHKIVLQFQAKGNDIQKCEEILINIIDFYSDVEHTEISDNIGIIGARPVTSAPIILGYTDTFNAILLANIELDVVIENQVKY